jgi:hypothetical protein
MDINPVNYKDYIGVILSIRNRQEFVKVLETALICNYSLWFTEIGDIYIRNYGSDCSLPSYKPERVRDHNYVVTIYNRYD